ncbi:MAG TPA: hypothetical protein VFW11_19150 [Cyclobacteriaceae bacterium]|nr:hypothetical protein [Cyclobacteriaceae bacterium]
MKTKSIFISALMIFGAVLSSVANDGLAVVPVKGSNVYKVIYKGEAQGKVKLSLYNKKSELIFSETVNQNGFILPLNFSKLEAGEYTVELADANGKQTQKIVHGATTPSTNYIHVSKLTSGDGKYLVSVRNADAINVKIYSRNGLIFDESRSLSGDFAQVYAVKVSGELTFEITDTKGNVKTARF